MEKRKCPLCATEHILGNRWPYWISVKDRLPEDGQEVIAAYAGVYDYRIVLYWEDEGPHFGHPAEKDGKGSQPATHWLPLPPPLTQ